MLSLYMLKEWGHVDICICTVNVSPSWWYEEDRRNVSYIVNTIADDDLATQETSLPQNVWVLASEGLIKLKYIKLIAGFPFTNMD